MQNRDKFRHNKKRNTAFLFEALVKELTKAVVHGESNKQKTISSIIKEHFNKKTLLNQELSLYKQLYETKQFPKEIGEKLINQIKAERDKLNETELFSEQSKLIAKINKAVGFQVYDNFVPSYKTLATISQIFNRQIETKQKILLEQELLGHITGAAPEKKLVLERTDAFTFRRFVERFNTEYNDKLLSEQKELLNRFINNTEDGVDLKVYLNEEIDRLKGELKAIFNTDLLKENSELANKVKLVNETLTKLKIQNIDEELIKRVMYIQQFVSEVKN
jgi:hypothetical protein